MAWGDDLKAKLEREGKFGLGVDKPKRKRRGTLAERCQRAHGEPGEVVFSFVLFGAPRTKKNHIEAYGVQSKAYRAYAKLALAQFTALVPPIDFPVNLRAIVYRKTASGDLIGYLQGTCDILEEAGIVTNDDWIRGFDGSRPAKDADNPRVELQLERLAP